MRRPELLSPAGTLKSQRFAFAFGADAVYAGLPRYSLRVRNNDYNLERLQQGVQQAHRNQKKFYLACNIIAHESKVKTFLADIAAVVAAGPDALIMADPGLIMLVRDRWPGIPVHLSVQANTLNSAAVEFWKRIGLQRIILSRELSLGEIDVIRQRCPDIELEVFVHGALCVAYSGRCLLSGYFNHREANQGACTNACRWEYKVHPPQSDLSEQLDQPYAFLEEQRRPGELMPVFEDEHGTYILNSKDLRALEHVARLAEIGIDALKIEGRTKSHYYVARTAQVYRQAIDDAMAGRPLQADLLQQLDGLANRGYTDGFYQRHPSHELQAYGNGCSENMRQRFVGEVVAHDRTTGLAVVEVKNRFALGDTLELLTPGGNRPFRLERMEDRRGNRLAEAPGAGYQVRIGIPVDDAQFGLLAINLVEAEPG